MVLTHGLSLSDRWMINVVTTMIVARAMLEDGTNGTVHCCQSHTLTTVHPVTGTAHVVDVDTGAAPGLTTTSDPALLWCVVVITVI